jgi:4-hydroxybenzoate polyprenyltransferase
LNFFYFLINTNIYISLAAVILTVETQIQLGEKPQWHPYLFIIFFATIFEYNLHRFVTILTNPDALKGEKHKWVNNNKTGFYLLVTASVVGFIIAAFFARPQVLLALAPIGALTLFYSLPVFKTKGALVRLREIPFLKIFLISFVWAATTILLPIIQTGIKYDLTETVLMLIERSLFVFAITIPFDIRDMASDQQSGLKTFPLLLGEKKAILSANIAIILFLGLCICHYTTQSSRFLLPAFIISALSTFIFINNKKVQKLYYYHYGVLDGTMMLQGLLVIVCYYLSL